MAKNNFPHVLRTYVTLDDRGHRILNVVTDLPTNPFRPGFDAEALHTLNAALVKLLGPERGYDRIQLHSKEDIGHAQRSRSKKRLADQ
jgi:hypothetical protein